MDVLWRAVLVVAVATALLYSSAIGASGFCGTKGPSSSRPSYLVPLSGATAVAIMTAADVVPRSTGGAPYMLQAGIEGAGAMVDPLDPATFYLFASHQLGNAGALVHQNGQRGSMVSRLRVHRRTLAVLDGRDIVTAPTQMHMGVGGSLTFDNLCHGDLAPRSAYYNRASGLGLATPGARIYLAAEQNFTFTMARNRILAFVVSEDGEAEAYALPPLGQSRASLERATPSPYEQDATVVVLNRNGMIAGGVSGPGPLLIYVGQKTLQTVTTSALEAAGLMNGVLYAVYAPALPLETEAVLGAPVPFQMTLVGDVSALSASQLEAQLAALGAATLFGSPGSSNGINGGTWNPTPGAQNEYYFTTQLIDAPRIWRLTFADITNVSAGGTLAQVQMPLGGGHFDAIGHGGIVPASPMAIYVSTSTARPIAPAVHWRYDLGDAGGAGGLQVPIAALNTSIFNAPGEAGATLNVTDVVGPGWMLISQRGGNQINAPAVGGDGQLLLVYDPARAYNVPPVIFSIASVGAPANCLAMNVSVDAYDPNGVWCTTPDHIVNYTYWFGDGSAPLVTASASAAHVYAVTGVYNVTVVARDTFGAASTALVALAHVCVAAPTPLPAPTPPTPAPSACSALDMATIEASADCANCFNTTGPLAYCPTLEACQGDLISTLSADCLNCLVAELQTGQTAEHTLATCAPPVPPCEATGCGSGGHCVAQACQCCAGFRGARCEERYCTAAACGAHGACNDVHGVCVCASGWAGAACNVALCSGHGTWSAATRLCRCAAGWEGALCDERSGALPPPPRGGACGTSALTLRHECTCRLDDGATCRSVFSANNTGAAPLAAPAGSALNRFFPGDADRGQPHVYAPAAPVRVTVEWQCAAEQRLTWIVRAATAFAEAVAVPSDAPCGSECGCGVETRRRVEVR